MSGKKTEYHFDYTYFVYMIFVYAYRIEKEGEQNKWFDDKDLFALIEKNGSDHFFF